MPQGGNEQSSRKGTWRPDMDHLGLLPLKF